MGLQKLPIGLLGKMPTQGDFVRSNVSGTVWRLFDAWLQDGLFLAQKRARLEEGFAGLPGYAFLFTPSNGAQSLMGYIQPSCDHIGRKFPLAMAATLEAHQLNAPGFHILPACFEPFLLHVRDVMVRAVSRDIDRTALMAEIERLSTEGLSRNEADIYTDHLANRTWKSLCEDLWGAFDSAYKYLLFKNLFDLLLPLAGNVPLHYSLGFRFPGSKTGIVDSKDTSFFLDLVIRVIRHAKVTPTLFWRVPQKGESANSSALIFLRSPAARVVPDFIPDEIDSDHICDMDNIGLKSLASAHENISADQKEVLDDPDATLKDIISLI